MQINLPNMLTWLRILIIPVLIASFYWDNFVPNTKFGIWLCIVLFLLAAISDWLDGYLARKFNLYSKFGAFLDPVADKLIVITVLVLLLPKINSIWFTLPVIFIIGREIVISALREWMANNFTENKAVQVSWLGKIKTTMQMMAVLGFFYYLINPIWIVAMLGYILLYSALLLTVWSMLDYFLASWAFLNKK